MNNPMPVTPRDLIILALRAANIIGVGQNASSEDINDSFNHLNMMMARWRESRANVFHLVTNAIQCTGAKAYTVGPGGDFDIGNVRDIESAYVTQFKDSAQQVDYWLTQIPAMETYNRLALKNLQSFPSVFYFDPGYPLGSIYVWPLPDTQYWLNISTRAELQQFDNLTDEIVLPPIYQDAMFWNLVVRLCTAYGFPVTDDHRAQARAALNSLQQLNAQVPLLEMPSALKARQGMFNIYGDNYVGGSQ